MAVKLNKMTTQSLLTTYSFTEEDINLITYALRKLKDETPFTTINNDSFDLLEFIKRQQEEKKA